MMSRFQCMGLVMGGLGMFFMSAMLVVLLNTRQDPGEYIEYSGVGKSLQASPSFTHGSTTIDLGGGMQGILDLSSVTRQIEMLQNENEKLKAILKRSMESQIGAKMKGMDSRGSGGNGILDSANAPAALVSSEQAHEICIDMVDFLGTVGYYVGVSYDPKVCFPSLNVSFGSAGPQAVAETRARIKEDMVNALARIKKVDVKAIETSKMYHEIPGGSVNYPEHIAEALRILPHDNEFLKWRDAISVVLAKYAADPEGNLFVNCPGVPRPTPIDKLGSYCLDLSPSVIIEKFGYYVAPFESIDSIMQLAVDHGWCSTHTRNFRNSYLDWLKKDRMTTEWRTFNAPSVAADHVLLLFDMLYERELIFTRQFWMGVATMQNPFDMYSIQDIIFTVRPDIMIETGTASGGSALLWSGIMELMEMEDSKVISIDVNEPSIWNEGPTSWRTNPVEHKLWKKRVSFIKGYSTEQKVVAEVVTKARKVEKVLVTLDSGHDKENVLSEMNIYCPLVSVGSYCIVEDTKMSRWHSTGPLAAVKEFLEKHPNFKMDRDRELLYTHHAMGYLKRIS